MAARTGFCSFGTRSSAAARVKYKLGKDVNDWNIPSAQKDIGRPNPELLTRITYRPFDQRWTYYTGNSRGFICRPRFEVMRHMFLSNIGFGFTRTIEGSRLFADAFVFDRPITHHSLSIKEVNIICPLYLYPTDQDLDQTRRVNFDPALYAKLQSLATHPEHGTPDELTTFDYLYGVLHSPAYRDTYAEFLKIDFPRIPWPTSPQQFWDIAAKGGQLRRLHLLDPAAIGPTPYPFTGHGDNTISGGTFQWRHLPDAAACDDTFQCRHLPDAAASGNTFKVSPEKKATAGSRRHVPQTQDASATALQTGKIYINPTQYFDNIPATAWDFYIGGYQPAQKWLKDRKGRTLSFEDIKHYQRIIKILSETHRIMHTIHIDL